MKKIKFLDIYLFEMQMKGYYEPEETWEDFVKKTKFDHLKFKDIIDFITFKSGDMYPLADCPEDQPFYSVNQIPDAKKQYKERIKYYRRQNANSSKSSD